MAKKKHNKKELKRKNKLITIVINFLIQLLVGLLLILFNKVSCAMLGKDKRLNANIKNKLLSFFKAIGILIVINNFWKRSKLML